MAPYHLSQREHFITYTIGDITVTLDHIGLCPNCIKFRSVITSFSIFIPQFHFLSPTLHCNETSSRIREIVNRESFTDQYHDFPGFAITITRRGLPPARPSSHRANQSAFAKSRSRCPSHGAPEVRVVVTTTQHTLVMHASHSRYFPSQPPPPPLPLLLPSTLPSSPPTP